MLPAIPDYELLRPIGRGAYGEVWLVRSVTGVYRAAKVVYRSNFQEPRPFEREFIGIQRFEPLSRSQDSQISILHIGRNESAGYFYYVMELADDVGSEESKPGSPAAFDPADYKPKTLREVLTRRGRLPSQDCVKLGVGLCNALAHLHENGLIHRDVKPANIIFVSGQPKLADIGLVSSIDATRSFVGTEGYVPPEGPGTPAADLYSLGKVLYECLTGRHRSEFPLLPEHFESVQDRSAVLELNEIVLKACSESRTTRYASASELRTELLLLQAGKSVKRLRSMERRFKRLVPAVAVAALLAGAIIAIQRWENAQVRERARLEAEYRDRAESQRAAMRQLLYAADMNLAQHAYAEGDYGRLETLLSAQVPRSGEPDLRGFEWRYFQKASQGQQQYTFGGYSNSVRRVAYSPDGGLLASASFDQWLRIWNTTNHQLAYAFYDDDGLDDVAFTDDGKRVLSLNQSGVLRCYDLASRQLAYQKTNQIKGIASSPAGDLLAISVSEAPPPDAAVPEAGPSHVVVLNASNGNELFSLAEPGWILQFSSDGTTLAAGSYEHTQVWDIGTRRVVTTLETPNVRFDLCLSPDKAFLAQGDGVGHLRIWRLDHPSRPHEIDTHQGAVWKIAFSPDGRLLASSGTDQSLRLWDPGTLKEIKSFRGHRGEVWGIAFSPDGRQIASAGKDATVRLWNLDQMPNDPVLTRKAVFWNWPVFSADGKWVAVGISEGIGVWRTTDGARQEIITNAVRPLGFDESGTALWVLGFDSTLRLASLQPNPAPDRIISIGNIDPTSVTAHALHRGLRLLALGQKDGIIRIWSLENGTELRNWKAHPARITSLTFSGTGDRLVSSSLDDADVKVWRVPEGTLSLTLSGHKIGIFDTALSPDGRLIATASPDDTCRLWDASTGKPAAVLTGHRGGAYGVSFATDGKTLAVGTGDSSVRLWNLRTLRDMGVIATDPFAAFYTGFSPDGSTLATVSLDHPSDNCSLRLFRAD